LASASSIIGWSFTASPSIGSIKQPSSNWRAALRAGGLLLLLLVCLPLHLLSKWLRGRSRWPHRFLSSAARVCGVKIRIVGPKPYAHTLLLANHLSWLDIFILSSATGCAFVSKDRLGPRLVHWLADQNRTLYIDRTARRSSGDQVSAIRRALGRRQPLALFPEGTTGPGDQLLPFRSTLLAAVAPPPQDVSVQPVAIDYASAAPEIAWHDEPALRNAMRVLGRKGPLRVTVRLLERLPRTDDRKKLAALAHERIDASLAASSSTVHRL
jgi:1-acyl-sn-glycerol-3-phosphate acyltransferase